MSVKSVLLSASAAAICFVPIASVAAPIKSEAYVTVTSGNFGETATSDTQESIVNIGTATDTTGGTAEVGDRGPFGTGELFGNFAVQKSNGESEVNAESTGGGSTDFELITSQALLTQFETNTTNATREYFLNFTLQGLEASILHSTDQVEFPIIEVNRNSRSILPQANETLTAVNPFGETPADITASSVTAASFEYFIEVNGNSVFNTRADALVSFEDGAVTFGSGDDSIFGDTATLNGTFDRGFSFEIPEILDQRIDLGTFDAGAEISVVSGLIARGYSHDGVGFVFGGCESSGDDFCGGEFFFNGVDSFFSDPVILSSIGSAPVNTTPVPLPAAGWLLIAGLGGMAAVGRRRKKA